MISVAEARKLVDLTERNNDPRARVAEHLIRVLLALGALRQQHGKALAKDPSLQLAQEHAEIAVRVLLAKELSL